MRTPRRSLLALTASAAGLSLAVTMALADAFYEAAIDQ